MRGDLKYALSLAYEIIELAEPENLKSFIREQEDLIARIKKISKEREEKERERIRLEQARLRLEKIKKLKTELSQLEHSFNAGLNMEDFLKTEETIEKAKNLLSEFKDDDIKKKWENLENRHNEAKTKKELILEAKELIEESIVLKEKFLFDTLKPKLSSIIDKLREHKVEDHLQELEFIQTDIIKAEKAYLNVVKSLDELKKEINSFQKNRKFKNAISHCENLLKLAESINKFELIEEYSKLLVELQRDLSFEELKETVQKLNDEGLNLLRKGEIPLSLDKFKLIRGSIDYYLKET